MAAISASTEEFARNKAAHTLTTSYGLQYSPHYLRKSREVNAASRQPVREAAASLAPPSLPPEALAQSSAGKVGRNDPCPCGSGRKYKKCHGQTSAA